MVMLKREYSMDGPCLHISLYDYRSGGRGPGLQCLMGCAANLELHGDNLPDSGAKVFLQRPTEGNFPIFENENGRRQFDNIGLTDLNNCRRRYSNIDERSRHFTSDRN